MSAPRNCCGLRRREQRSKSKQGIWRRTKTGGGAGCILYLGSGLYKVDYQNSPPLILKLLTGGLLLGALKAGSFWSINSYTPGLGPPGIGYSIVISRVWAANTSPSLGPGMSPCLCAGKALMDGFCIFPGGEVGIESRPLDQQLLDRVGAAAV